MPDGAFEFLDPGPLQDGDLNLVLIESYAGNPVLGLVPAYRFVMRIAGRQAAAGSIEFRVGNSKHITYYAGHLGYRVSAQYRGRHYAARACRLLMPLARRHGLRELWITCNPDNLASRRTCELAGAEFVEIVDLPTDTDMYRRGERQKCRYRLAL